MSRTVLVTGGSGYFGTILVDQILAAGDRARILDVNAPESREGVEVVVGDVRDRSVVEAACDGADVVMHNVAQVPLARDRELFWSVNVLGTANVLLAARNTGVGKVVHTSTSAIYGIPETNPVDEDTPPTPLEAYGRAKLEAETLCHDAARSGLDVTIVRPRTILGHGRRGIMAMLFELVAEGAPVVVLDGGHNRSQFVHGDDLASACLLASRRPGATSYNVGAREFGSMRETLEALCDHAGTGARVRSMPSAPARIGMQAASSIGLAPFAPYHWLLYGESLWFDTSKAESELGWEPVHSNASMVIESYEWWRAHAHGLDDGARSHHQRPARSRLLGLLRFLP